MAEPREQIAQALSTYLTPEQVSKLIDEVLAIEKRASVGVTCKKCHHNQMAWVKVLDARAVTSALTDLMAQAFGRPQEANTQTEPIQFYRLTNMEEVDALRLVQKEWGGQSGQHPEDGVVRPEPDEREGVQQAEKHTNMQSVDSEVLDPETLRRCVACHDLKPKAMFYPSRRGAQVCRECRK